MIVKRRRYEYVLFSLLFVAATFFTGCASHLDKGWDHFSKGKYVEAQSEWVKSKDPILTEEINKAKAAVLLVELDGKITAAEAKKDYVAVFKDAQAALMLNKWQNRDWLEKSPKLKTYLENAQYVIDTLPDVINSPGFYRGSKLGFSMTWPAEVLSVADKLGPGEIIRVHAANAYKIPVLHVAVSDKEKDAKPISEFKAIAKAYKDGLKASQAVTKSKRFKLRESKLVTLANGVQGVYSMTTWKYGGSFGLVTVNLTLYASKKVINVGITSAPGNPPIEVMEKWLMAAVVE